MKNKHDKNEKYTAKSDQRIGFSFPFIRRFGTRTASFYFQIESKYTMPVFQLSIPGFPRAKP
jgi:hypothetical protein